MKALARNLDTNLYNSNTPLTYAAAVLFFVLLFTVPIVGYWLWSFCNSILLHPLVVELFADYALPVAVLFGAVIGSGMFYQVDLETLPTSTQV